jgi:hypothetical protein
VTFGELCHETNSLPQGGDEVHQEGDGDDEAAGALGQASVALGFGHWRRHLVDDAGECVGFVHVEVVQHEVAGGAEQARSHQVVQHVLITRNIHHITRCKV